MNTISNIDSEGLDFVFANFLEPVSVRFGGSRVALVRFAAAAVIGEFVCKRLVLCVVRLRCVALIRQSCEVSQERSKIDRTGAEENRR